MNQFAKLESKVCHSTSIYKAKNKEMNFSPKVYPHNTATSTILKEHSFTFKSLYSHSQHFTIDSRPHHTYRIIGLLDLIVNQQSKSNSGITKSNLIQLACNKLQNK